MSVVAWVVLSLLCALALFWVGVALVARAAIRSVRRNRSLQRSVLRNRARFSVGPRRQVAQLRLRLADALDGGRAPLELTAKPNPEVRLLFRRIDREARILDDRLRLMDSEADVAVLAHDLAAVGPRVDAVVDMVRQLRSAVTRRRSELDDDLADLRGEVDREMDAMRAGDLSLRHLRRDAS